MLKSYGVGWGGVGGGVGGPFDFSVSPSPFCLDFGTSDLGLTILVIEIQMDTSWHSLTTPVTGS